MLLPSPSPAIINYRLSVHLLLSVDLSNLGKAKKRQYIHVQIVLIELFSCLPGLSVGEAPLGSVLLIFVAVARGERTACSKKELFYVHAF